MVGLEPTRNYPAVFETAMFTNFIISAKCEYQPRVTIPAKAANLAERVYKAPLNTCSDWQIGAARVELAQPKPTDFKSVVSTDSTMLP
jgi:hypothetical protein